MTPALRLLPLVGPTGFVFGVPFELAWHGTGEWEEIALVTGVAWLVAGTLIAIGLAALLWPRAAHAATGTPRDPARARTLGLAAAAAGVAALLAANSGKEGLWIAAAMAGAAALAGLAAARRGPRARASRAAELASAATLLALVALDLVAGSS